MKMVSRLAGQQARFPRSWQKIALFGFFVFLAIPGCSIRRMAVKGLAETLAESGDVFGSDEDPELIRAAAPFSLKTIESLIQEFPDHPGLLLSACSGFTQYAYAFIQTDAEFLEPTNYQASLHLRERAIKMYLRARDYCIRNALLHKSLRHVRLSPMGQGASMRNDAKSIHVPVPSTQLVRLQSGADRQGASDLLVR